MQEKFNQTTIPWFFLGLAIYATELTFRVGLVLVWNLIFSIRVNQILFGTDSLALIKGLLLISILHYIFMPTRYCIDYVTNNKLLKEWRYKDGK